MISAVPGAEKRSTNCDSMIAFQEDGDGWKERHTRRDRAEASHPLQAVH